MIRNFKVIDTGEPRMNELRQYFEAVPIPRGPLKTTWPTSPPKSPPINKACGTSWRSFQQLHLQDNDVFFFFFFFFMYLVQFMLDHR